jgi:catecholate siderophore receptor
MKAGTAGQRRAELDLNIPSSQKGTAFRLTGALEDSSNFRNQYFLERNAIALRSVIRFLRYESSVAGRLSAR